MSKTPRADLTSAELADLAFGSRGMLLPNEDPATEFAVDARRWIVVYEELVNFKSELIARLEEHLTGLTAEAQHELASTDVAALRDQQQIYVGRLDYWQRRHWELQKLDMDPVARTATYRNKTIVLTPREYGLLRYFLGHPGRLFLAERLAAGAWGSSRIAPEEVRTYIGLVRRKLRELGAPCEITNTPRRGYALVFTD